MIRAERRPRPAKPQRRGHSPVVALSLVRCGDLVYHPLIKHTISEWATEVNNGARVGCVCCETQFATIAAVVVVLDDAAGIFVGEVCERCARQPDADIISQGAERYRPGLAKVHLIDPANLHVQGGRA